MADSDWLITGGKYAINFYFFQTKLPVLGPKLGPSGMRTFSFHGDTEWDDSRKNIFSLNGSSCGLLFNLTESAQYNFAWLEKKDGTSSAG